MCLLCKIESDVLWLLSHRNSFFGDFIFLSISQQQQQPSVFENNGTKCLKLVIIGPAWPSLAQLGPAGLRLISHLWNKQDMPYYESFPLIGDFCSKPFGQFYYWFWAWEFYQMYDNNMGSFCDFGCCWTYHIQAANHVKIFLEWCIIY